MTIPSILSAALILSVLLLPSGSSDVDLLNNGRDRRRELQDDFVCPYDEERLYYNIDIDLEGIFTDGCVEQDLYNIGDLLAGIVDEAEEEIPQYKDSERIESTVCPFPLEEDIRRNLRATVTEESRRQLQDEPQPPSQPPTRRRRRRRKRYKFKGSGKCRRCRGENSDRRLQADACDSASVASYAASIAGSASKNAGEIVSDLSKYVLNYCEYTTSSGQETVLNANAWLQEGRNAQRIARKKAEQAKRQCQTASSPTSTNRQRRRSARFAGKASIGALNAAENARSQYFALRNAIESDICYREPVVGNVVITIQSVCDQADISEFGANMADAAVVSGSDSLSELKELVVQCDDLGSSQELVTDAQATLDKIKQAQTAARAAAEQARIQCQKADDTSSGSELIQYMQQAQELAGNVMNETKRAYSGHLQLKDIVERGDICDTQGEPRTDISVEAVCKRADAADFGAGIANTILSKAKAAYTNLREYALECDNLTSGQVWIIQAKTLMSQCSAARNLALNQAESAKAICQNANAASTSELRAYLLAAGAASRAALNAAEDAKSNYLSIRGEGNEDIFNRDGGDKDICSQGAVARRMDVSAESICQNAEIASYGADMAATAVTEANALFSSQQERSMECSDLSAGEAIATGARQAFAKAQRARRRAASGARRARNECERAKQAEKANQTSSSELEQGLSTAERFANDAMKRAEQAKNLYSRMGYSLSSSICGEDTTATEEPSDEYEERTPEPGSPIYIWLQRLADILEERIPTEVLRVYGNSPTADGCELEVVQGIIQIDAFEQIDDRDYWIGEKTECITLGL